MLTSSQIRAHLGVTASRLRRLVADGLPHVTVGKCRRFELDSVNEWLVSRGYAERRETETVCRTYAELARALCLTGKDPQRTIAGWVTQPGFPGRPGTPGRRDAVLPVDQIRDWLATRGGAATPAADDETRALQRESQRLRLEISNRELQAQLGRLADVDDVARFNRQVVSDAMAILAPLADEVVGLLPAGTPETVRRRVHSAVEALLLTSRETIAQVIEGELDADDRD